MQDDSIFETLLDVIPFGIYVVDVHTYEIVYLNRVIRDQMRPIKNVAVGDVCYRALHGEDKPCLFCKIGTLVENGKPNGASCVFEQFNALTDSWFQLHERAAFWPDGRTVKYSIAVGIEELKETQNRLAEAHALLALKNKQLERLSNTDWLTGLANRLMLERMFSSELEKVGRYGRPLSCVVMDLDHFKSINDTYGHEAGDTMLIEVADLLRQGVRKTDLLGRWGGEEFCIICPETDLEGAQTLAENLRQRIDAHTFSVVENLTGSFGVTSHRLGDSRKSMVQRADEALYRAKKHGRNRVECG